LEAKRLGIDPEDEEFTALPFSHIDIVYLSDITGSDIYEFMLYAGQSRGNGWSAKSRKLSTLKVFFKYLHIHKHILDRDPTEDIGAPRRHVTLPKFLSLDESLLLLDTIKNDPESKTTVRDFCIVTLFLNCGMRLSELTGINLTDLDRDLRSLRFIGKGNKERVIYLNDACRAAIVDYLNERKGEDTSSIRTKALFLSRRHERISNKTVQWMVGKYLNAAGLGGRGLSVHKLRHTAATLMYQSGDVDVRVLKDILGHAQLNTTQIYTHVSNENMERAIAANPLASAKIKKRKKEDTDNE
jgi:site-specific recombinase XerD